LARALKRIFFTIVVRISTRVITISEFARDSLARDLHLPRQDIELVRLPIDTERAARIVGMRERLGQEDALLYLGRFDEHKNLRRLVEAFGSTRFAASGGKLVIAGGWAEEVDELSRWVKGRDGRVEVAGAWTEEEVDRALATSRALISPSLEEGYGLPAFEAAAAGLPVAVSPTGAMMELAPEIAVRLDPSSTADIARAIDEVVGRRAAGVRDLVTPELASVVLGSIRNVLGTR
jgi:glycosyltransferase involved in cell wall biosynthesis